DLIVCMAGRPVGQGLAAAEVYKMGYAPKIFIPREEPPDGDEVLKARGVHYPHESELLIEMLQGLGVPRSACITSDHPASSSLEEAKMVRELAARKGYHSIIVVTSPAQTRCTRVIFKNVFDKDDLKIIMTPSRYTNFKAGDWWRTDKYLKEVIIEYQKLIYYTLKGLW
ncbi:MAG: YdcF family protein, partial [Pseudomonadota bacterium]